MSDFWPFQPTAGVIFDSGDLQSIGLRVAQKKNFEKKNWENFQKTSKLSKNIFWASSDHVVAQKSMFWKKSSKKSLSQGPPPFSYMRDIHRQYWAENAMFILPLKSHVICHI